MNTIHVEWLSITHMTGKHICKRADERILVLVPLSKRRRELEMALEYSSRQNG